MRSKWFLPADDRPSDPLSCFSSRSRAAMASMEARATSLTPPQTASGTDPAELLIAVSVEPVLVGESVTGVAAGATGMDRPGGAP